MDGSTGHDLSIHPAVQPWTPPLQGEDGAFTQATAAFGLDLHARRRGLLWAHLDDDGQPGEPHPEAIGAAHDVEAGGRSHRAAIRAGGLNLASSGPRTARLSLPGADRIDRLQIRWPDGLETTHLGLAIDGQLLLTRPSD